MNLVLMEKLEAELSSSTTIPFQVRNELLSSLGVGVQYFKKEETTLWYPLFGVGYLKRLSISLGYYLPESDKSEMEKDFFRTLSCFLNGDVPLELMEEYAFELTDSAFAHKRSMLLCFISYQVIRDSIHDLAGLDLLTFDVRRLQGFDIPFHLSFQTPDKVLFWRQWIEMVRSTSLISSKNDIEILLRELL